MWKVFSFEHLGLERSRIGIEAPSLVHENRMVSMPGGWDCQPTSLFG